MSAGSRGTIWQTPYVNLFKHFGVGKWKKSSKDGDVTTYMDRDVKSTVFRVGGSVPANNYIMLPKSSSQSLGLTGHFFYLLFRPLPARYFVIHLEVVTSSSMVVRVSFSNLFKEFKSTSTWLQFPYRHGDAEVGIMGGSGVASSRNAAMWTFLCLDLREILSKYLSTSYSYIKNIKLCANILVKNAFTSEIEYSPMELPGSSGGSYLQPPPRDMCLLVPKGAEFLDVFNYVRFPCDERRRRGQLGTPRQPKLLRGLKPGAVLVSVSGDRNDLKSKRTESQSNQMTNRSERRGILRQSPGGTSKAEKLHSVDGGGMEYYVKREADNLSREQSDGGPASMTDRRLRLAQHTSGRESGRGYGRSIEHSPGAAGSARCERVRPNVSWSVGPSSEGGEEEEKGEEKKHTERKDREEKDRGRESEGDEDASTEDGGLHIHVDSGTKVMLSRDSASGIRKHHTSSLQPDPILKLNKVIGFGGVTTRQALFVGADGGSVIYPCHSLVVSMDTTTGKQKFFSGHTRKVSCISLSQDGSLLASGQTGCPAVVRVWEVESGRCLGLFQTHHKDLHSLNFSATGSVLCGVGRNSHGKTQVVLWRTIQVREHGDVAVVARAHTEASIQRMRISGFDDTRMVSCGWDNVRFWRVKGGNLRSCPVNLEDYHQMHFTDIQFQPGYHKDSDLCNRNVYACTTTGHMFEIHYKRISILRVWHLVPDQTIHSLSLHDAFCVTGSEDGILRVWPMDFSAVFMEAQHEGEVTAVDVSADGFRVLAGTSVGNLGILDASSQKYRTLMRSHSGHVTSMSVSKQSNSHLVSCSEDKTIRVWDLPEGAQSYDFRLHGDQASCVCTGPRGGLFACGFSSGIVRFFKLPSTDILAEHKTHGGLVNGLVFSPSGRHLYSCSTSGSLALFSLQDGHTPKLLRLLGNIVAKMDGSSKSGSGERNHAPTKTLALSQDGSRLALIGPFNYTITVLDADTLNEILRLDITPVTPSSNRSNTFIDTARLIAFSPKLLNEIVVMTKDSRLLKFCASSGRLLSEVPQLHRGRCSSMVVSEEGRYLVTAGDQVLKVWSYTMATELNFQVFIGHSDLITDVCFTSDGRYLLSCGDAIFLWELMGGALTPTPSSSTSHAGTPVKTTPPPRTSSALSGLRSASPRKRVPTPAAYDPLKMQVFTPMGPGVRTKCGSDTAESSVIGMESSSRARPILDIDDDDLYELHAKEDGRPKGGEASGANKSDRHGNAKNSGNEGLDGKEADCEDQNIQSNGRSTPVNLTPAILSSSPSSSSMSSVSSSLYPLTPPTAAVHQFPRSSKCGLAPHLYLAPPEDAGIKRRAAWGLNSCARNNLVWHPDSGLFVYGSGCLGVIEDLSTGKQKHLEGHAEEINCVCVQHDGHVVAGACLSSQHAPCQIRVWDIASAKCIKVLAFHGHAVQSLSYSRDDRLLLSIGNYQDGSLAVWGTWDYSLLAATSLSHAIHGHAWDPFTAYEFVTVGVWEGVGGVNFWLVEDDMGGKKCQLKLHEPDLPEDLLRTGSDSSLEFTSVCYGAQPLVFVGSDNGVVSMWEGVGNTCLLFWRTESCELSCLLATVEGMLLVGTVTGTLQLWSIEGNATPSETPPKVTLKAKMDVDIGRITSACFNKSMQLGVVGSSSGLAWYINWPERNKLKLVGGHSAEVTTAAFSTDSTHFASASRDGTVVVWNTLSKEQLVVFRDPRQSCTSVAFAPPSGATRGGKEGKRKKRRGEDGKEALRDGRGRAEAGEVPYVVAGYGDGNLRVFDVKEARVVKKVQPHDKEVRAVTYSQDGRVILSGCSGGVVAVSSPTSGLVVRVITDHRDAPITDLQVAPNPIQLPCLGEGRWWLWLVASGDRRVSVWSADWQKDFCQLVDWLSFPGPPTAPDGTLLKKGAKCQYELLPPSLARFSPSDPDTIVYTGYGLECVVQFYSISKKMVLRTAALTHWVTALAISPQGHLLAFGCHERVLKLMDYEEGSFQDYMGHQDTVGTLSFSPSAKYLMSSSNTTIHQWNVLLQ